MFSGWSPGTKSSQGPNQGTASNSDRDSEATSDLIRRGKPFNHAVKEASPAPPRFVSGLPGALRAVRPLPLYDMGKGSHCTSGVG